MRKILLTLLYIIILVFITYITYLFYGYPDWLVILLIDICLYFFITFGALNIPCDYKKINPIFIECRYWPTCMDIIIDGKIIFHYSKRDEMYEKIIKSDLRHIFIKQPIFIFGSGCKELEIIITKYKNTAKIYRIYNDYKGIPSIPIEETDETPTVSSWATTSRRVIY